eukprot:TRINITY_DN8907_c0_g1_i2.p2 TRINITY_DN8907_c0_g1~~TRINITY_DN8907_c0_g1_i2.p2  ORF type:complete len:118 (+),score=24.99 TRINITY_DN8907_c0_g1_i2:35-355(+)
MYRVDEGVFIINSFTNTPSSTLYIVPLCTKCNNTHNTATMTTHHTAFVPIHMCSTFLTLPSSRFAGPPPESGPFYLLLTAAAFVIYLGIFAYLLGPVIYAWATDGK